MSIVRTLATLIYLKIHCICGPIFLCRKCVVYVLCSLSSFQKGTSEVVQRLKIAEYVPLYFPLRIDTEPDSKTFIGFYLNN